MPRNKSFDEDEVLGRIAQLFWRDGYTGTSMSQICMHVSLTKPSLYNAYGDKEELFRRSVDWYVDNVIAQVITTEEDEGSISDLISNMLRHFLISPDDETVGRGCLLTSSAMELRGTNEALYDHVIAQQQSVNKAVENYFRAAKKQGRLNDDADPIALSEYLLTVFQGLRVKSRVDMNKRSFRRIISMAMGPIEASETVKKSR